MVLVTIYCSTGSHVSLIEAFDLWHAISNNVVYVTSKGSDHPAHMRSLIRTFASHLNIV